MSVRVTCPKCQKKLKIDENVLGRKIKCPTCNAVFAAPSPDGTPEQSFQAVLAAYLQAVEAGQQPDRDVWLATHPDMAEQLRFFFANQDEFARRAEPLSAAPKPIATPSRPETLAQSPDETSVGEVGDMVPDFGDYVILEKIAAGGMGVVYKARQVSADRIVALKMILAGRLASESEVRRFHTEAEAAANLDHPHLVPIYDVGKHNGQHYFSMKFVAGGSLSAKIDELKSDPKSAVRLLATAAKAVHYAHQRGILHRDLKPANILVDAQGQPHVTDFGLAKKVGGDSGMTQTGAIVGTPSYMAPEQAAASKDLTVAVDVYSLGAILYELLTGQPPFRGETPMDTFSQVMEKEPRAPRSINPRVPRDPETICLKCLAKKPGRRYGSAEALAVDLERWLRHEPIEARRVGQLERGWMWVRRNPALAGMLTLLLVTLAATTTLAVQARLAEQRADEETQTTKALLYASQLQLVKAAWNENDAGLSLQLLKSTQPDYRSWEYWYLNTLLTTLNQRTFIAPAGQVTSVAIGPDSKRLVVGSSPHEEGAGDLTMWDVRKGQELLTLHGHMSSVNSVAFSLDGKRFVTGGTDNMVKVWDTENGRELFTLKGHAARVGSVAFSPDGKRVVSGSMDNTLKVWDAEKGQEIRTLDGPTGGSLGLAFSSDGKVIVVGSSDGAIKVWAAENYQEILSHNVPVRSIHCLAFSPDGKRVAFAESTIRVSVVASQGCGSKTTQGKVPSCHRASTARAIQSSSWRKRKRSRCCACAGPLPWANSSA
jgi:tRNA A-37 threonylcarbamoyl transferase component Bud32/sugar lactone lactonase YvrE